MNAIAPIAEDDSVENAIGWRPNLERLRHEAQLATSGHELDPLAVVEADCWLDLIDAELMAKSTQGNPRARAQLVVWRTEIARLRTLFESLDKGATQISGSRPEERAPHSEGTLEKWPQPLRTAAVLTHQQPVYGGRLNEISPAA